MSILFLLLVVSVYLGQANSSPPMLSPPDRWLSMERQTSNAEDIFATINSQREAKIVIPLRMSEESRKTLCPPMSDETLKEDISTTMNSSDTTVPVVNATTNRIFTTPALVSCRPGYKRVEDIGCYKIETQKREWGQARAFCEDDGSHLAIPDSMKELEALWEFQRQYHCSEVWIGVHYLDHVWVTVEGYRVWKSNWTATLPGNDDINYRSTSACSHVRNEEGPKAYQCYYSNPFICQ